LAPPAERLEVFNFEANVSGRAGRRPFDFVNEDLKMDLVASVIEDRQVARNAEQRPGKFRRDGLPF
jgi:hypothetical protein